MQALTLIPVHCRMKIVTVATMTRSNMAFVWNRLLMATNCNLKVFHAVNSLRCGKCSATALFPNRL